MDETHVLEVDSTGAFSTTEPDTDPRLVKEAALTLGALYLVLQEFPDLLSTSLTERTELALELIQSHTWSLIAEWFFGPEAQERSQAKRWIATIEQRLRANRPWYEVIGPLAEELSVRQAWMWRLIGWTIESLGDEDLPSSGFRDEFRLYQRQNDTPVRLDYITEIRLKHRRSKQPLIDHMIYRRAEMTDFSDIIITELYSKHSRANARRFARQTRVTAYPRFLTEFLHRRTGRRREESESAPVPKEKRSTAAHSRAPSDLLTLPSDLMSAYHRLVDKRLGEGLTPDEETELHEISRRLDAAEASTAMERAIDAKLSEEHQKRMEVLNDVIARLRSLRH